MVERTCRHLDGGPPSSEGAPGSLRGFRKWGSGTWSPAPPPGPRGISVCSDVLITIATGRLTQDICPDAASSSLLLPGSQKRMVQRGPAQPVMSDYTAHEADVLPRHDPSLEHGPHTGVRNVIIIQRREHVRASFIFC